MHSELAKQDVVAKKFPLSVRCESRDTIVFVACQRGFTYGDVRKTLAGLLQKEFDLITVAMGPRSEAHEESSPVDDNDFVDLSEDGSEFGVVMRAHILTRESRGGPWVAS